MKTISILSLLTSIIITILFLMLMGCSSKYETITMYEEPINKIKFDGFYHLTYSGYIDIVKDNGQLYDITLIRLVVKNKDNSYAYIPISSIYNLPVLNNKLYFIFNANYIASYNVKSDIDNTILNGNYLTLITIFKHNNKLKIRIEISNSNMKIFDKTINEE